MANRNGGSCCCSDDDDDDDDEEEDEDDDDDGSGSCSSCSTAEADGNGSGATRRRLTSGRTTAAAAATSFDLLDARRLSDLLDAERLVAVLDGCLESEYVRSCVVETWDAVLSEHLEAIAHLVLYQTPEHTVSQAVYEQLIGLSASLRPPTVNDGDQEQQQQRSQRPARVDAKRVYGTLRSAARSLLTTRVDACCRQSMCRAVGLAVAALRCSTRPVFSVENFVVEINEAANFANLYCTGYAKRICAALEGIYDTVMAGDYHPTNVVVQMAVMDKCIRAAVRTLADDRATAAQKTAAQRSLLAELDDVGATVRMKNHGCVDDADQPQRRQFAVATASSTARFVHFTMSPWRAPIRMYHQQSLTSMDQVLKATVRLVEALIAELFKPCLNGRNRANRRRRHRTCSSRQVHDKQL